MALFICHVKWQCVTMWWKNSDDPKFIQVCWRQWSVAGLPPMWNKLLFNAARLPSVSSNRNLYITVWATVPFSYTCLKMCYSLDTIKYWQTFFICPVDCVRGYVAAAMLMLTLLFTSLKRILLFEYSSFTSLQRQHRFLLSSAPFITWWFTSFCYCPHYTHPQAHTIILTLLSKHLSWFIITHS